MPILKHAKKKLKQDKVRTLRNKKLRSTYKTLIKKARKDPSAENMSAAFKQIDKAAKNHLMHENKAARLKSSLSKVTVSTEAKPQEDTKKTTAKKTAVKTPKKKVTKTTSKKK